MAKHRDKSGDAGDPGQKSGKHRSPKLVTRKEVDAKTEPKGRAVKVGNAYTWVPNQSKGK